MGLIDDITRRKPVESLQREADTGTGLRRVLGLWQLTAIGLGGIIGVGIFVLTGTVAATQAGPAVLLSFLLAGIASAAAALCYAEFAGLIPVSGSAYTYGYAVLGEFAGWIIGWDLLLEYALIAAVVAVGWSGYAQVLLDNFGLPLPTWAQGAWGTAPGRVVNLPAILISVLITALLAVRMEWGARFNTLIVAIKIAGAALIVIAGAAYVKPERWHPFMPFGMHGVVTGAAVVFFAVFGYDMLTTAAEESRNPQRDLPRAVLLSLGGLWGVRAARGRVAGSLSGGARLGIARLEGTPAGGPGVTGASAMRPWWGPMLSARGALGLGAVSLVLSLEVGITARGAEGLAGGATVLAIDGAWLTIGAGLRF